MDQVRGLHTEQGGEVAVFPHYVWIGGRDNRCVAIVSGADLVQLRDALNALVTVDA